MSDEYIDVIGIVKALSEKAVLLRIGNKGRQEWIPYSVMEEDEPTFERGDEVTVYISEGFLARRIPWLLRKDYEDYEGD